MQEKISSEKKDTPELIERFLRIYDRISQEAVEIDTELEKRFSTKDEVKEDAQHKQQLIHEQGVVNLFIPRSLRTGLGETYKDMQQQVTSGDINRLVLVGFNSGVLHQLLRAQYVYGVYCKSNSEFNQYGWVTKLVASISELEAILLEAGVKVDIPEPFTSPAGWEKDRSFPSIARFSSISNRITSNLPKSGTLVDISSFTFTLPNGRVFPVGCYIGLNPADWLQESVDTIIINPNGLPEGG